MKITDIFNNGKIASTKRKGRAGGTSDIEFGSLMEESETSEVASTAPSGGILGAGLVLPQALYSDVEVARKHISRGNRILDNLDEIRTQLLSGELSYDGLLRLKDEIKYAPQGEYDAKLQSIIKEIELRAEVEIAKIERVNNLV
jgi:hypothetical protein